MLKQHEWQHITEFDVDDLKVLLNIEDKYHRYRDFKSDVLEQVKWDLSEQTDISLQENREISEWEKHEFPAYLSNDFLQLGVGATPSVKNK